MPPKIRAIFAAGLIGLLTVRMAIVADVWFEHRRDLADLRSFIASVPAGALVYVTNVSQDEAPAYWGAGPRSRRISNLLRADYHLLALLLIERRAFWLVLFANPAQQPISLGQDTLDLRTRRTTFHRTMCCWRIRISAQQHLMSLTSC